MSFKSLEKRFSENVRKLYDKATSKFENGKESNGRNDAPFVVRTSGKGYWTKAESRMLPIRSTVEDVKRLTLFQLSTSGVLFLAKQQLLQTGNTFKFTRLINPAFVIANAVPFLHIKRNLRPLSELKGKTDTSYENVRKMGTMQSDSYDKLKKWKMPTFVQTHLNASTKQNSSIFRRAGTFLKNTVGNKLAKAFSPITNTLSAANPLLKRNVGEEKPWEESRPELAKDSIIDHVKKANSNYQKIHAETGEKFIRYFSPGQLDPAKSIYHGGISGLSVGEDVDGVVSINRKNSLDIERNQFKQKISYIKDPLNTKLKAKTKNELNPYSRLPIITNSSDGSLASELATLGTRGLSDIITVSFAMGKNDHVQFRAFIKDLQQNATPEYKQYQYIGRIEKFVNYLGIQREISFKLGIIAYGEDELETVWRRINYITAFVYPYGFNRGIMQPNIVRMTIGDLYTDQPGYVTSLGTNFSGLTDTWEISPGKQVPISAEMDIKFTLIEKYSKIASSPFYGYTEKMKLGDDRFVQPIVVPRTTQQQPKPSDAPTNQAPTQVAMTRAAASPADARPTPPLNTNSLSTLASQIFRRALP